MKSAIPVEVGTGGEGDPKVATESPRELWQKSVVAVDPGLSGGIAVSVCGVAGCREMPQTGGDTVSLLRGIKESSDKSGMETVCVLEAVSGFVGKAQPGSAMFKFGENYGFIKGVVQTLGMKLEMVRPQVWQKGFGLGTASGCASKTVWKNKLKAEAQRRFPGLEVTHKTADALLILEWALGKGLNRETRETHEAEARSASDLTAEGTKSAEGN